MGALPHVRMAAQSINTEVEKCDLCRHVCKAERGKKRTRIYTILMLTSLMDELGEHAHTRLCTYTHGVNVTVGSEGNHGTSEAY